MISPVLSDYNILSKKAEGKSRDCNINSSTANSILSNAPIVLPAVIDRGSDVPTNTKYITLLLVTWKVLGEIGDGGKYFSIYQNTKYASQMLYHTHIYHYCIERN